MRAIHLSVFLTILFACDVHAQVTVAPGDVLGVVTADWNEDGWPDRAVLVATGPERDTAALLVTLSNDGPERPDVQASNSAIAWTGSAWGQIASLETNSRSSIVVVSGNEAIGRHRWTRRVTIAYRGGRFVVAGHTYSEYDTLDPGAGYECDVNLLSGKGLLDGKSFRTSLRAPPLTDWTDDVAEQVCKNPGA